MSLTTQNFLNPLEFRFTVKRLPQTTFFVQSANVPGLNIGPVEQKTPFKSIYHTPDTITYEQLNIEFIVDQDMSNYLEIMNWIIGQTFPESFDQHKTLVEGEGLYSDATLTLMTGQGNAGKQIEFTDIFPIGLSEIALDTKNTDVQYATCTATFQTNGFKIK